MANETSKEKISHYKKLLNNDKARWTRIGSSRAMAEVSSILLANSSVGMLKSFTPNGYKATTQKLAQSTIIPNIAKFDELAVEMPTIFTQPGGGKELKDLPVEERAELYASDIVNNAAMFFSGMVGQGVTQDIIDKQMGMPEFGKTSEKFKRQGLAIVVDKAIQSGAFYLLNVTKTGQSANLSMQQSLKGVLQKNFDMDEDAAEDKSRYMVSFAIPNVTGAAGSIATLESAYSKRMADLLKAAGEVAKSGHLRA